MKRREKKNKKKQLSINILLGITSHNSIQSITSFTAGHSSVIMHYRCSTKRSAAGKAKKAVNMAHVCTVCLLKVDRKENSVFCIKCTKWIHQICSGLNEEQISAEKSLH